MYFYHDIIYNLSYKTLHMHFNNKLTTELFMFAENIIELNKNLEHILMSMAKMELMCWWRLFYIC